MVVVTKPLPIRKMLFLAAAVRAPRRIVRQDRGVRGTATVAPAIRAKTAPWARTAAWAAVETQNLTQLAAPSELTNATARYFEVFWHRLLDHGDLADAVFSGLPDQRPRAMGAPMTRTHAYFTTGQLDVRLRPPQIFSTRFEELFKREISSLSPPMGQVIGVGLRYRQ